MGPLAGLAISFLILIKFVLPAILEGSDPLWVAITGGAMIMFLPTKRHANRERAKSAQSLLSCVAKASPGAPGSRSDLSSRDQFCLAAQQGFQPSPPQDVPIVEFGERPELP